MSRELRVRLGAAGILVIVFVSGIAVGFALDRDVAEASTEERTEQPERSDPLPPREGWIIDRLDLTEEQRAEVDSVIAYYGSHMGDLQREYRPRFRSLVDSTRRALRDVLTDEQLERYEVIEAEIERRRREAGDRR